MFGYYINTDYPLLKESACDFNGKKVISCYQDGRIQHWKQNESTVFIGTNKYNTISVYQCLGGKLVTVKDMGEFFVNGNHILYHVSSNCFSEEAICTTISTHIMGNIMLEDNYLLHATTLLKNSHALCILGGLVLGSLLFRSN